MAGSPKKRARREAARLANQGHPPPPSAASVPPARKLTRAEQKKADRATARAQAFSIAEQVVEDILEDYAPIEPESGGGRRSSLTMHARRRFLRGVVLGLTQTQASEYAGIHPETVVRWLTIGREADPERADADLYVTFAEQNSRARAHALARLTEYILEAAPTDWRAAQFSLERRAHEQWGRRDNLEISGTDGGPININGDPLGALSAALDAVAKRHAEELDDTEEEGKA